MSYNGNEVMTVENGRDLLKAVDKKTNYVTPEMFGAKADGSTDDTTAIQAAIDYGRTNGTAVRGFKAYTTAGTLTISGNYMDVYIHRINYSGSSNALTIRGSYHQLRFGSIYCNSGAGVIYKADTTGVLRNNFIAGRIYCANGHCIDLQGSSSYSVYYNTFNIRDVKSDTGNCFNGNDLAVGENTFYNSTCSCPSGWAIYQMHGRFYNFSLEGNVLNGIYNSYGYFAGFRVRELVDKVVYEINGRVAATGGKLVKFSGTDTGYVFKFISEDFIPYEAIDVSEVESAEDMTEITPFPGGRAGQLTYFKIIDAPIRIGNWDTNNGFSVPGKGMILAGNRKICIPAYETSITITDPDYDLRDAQVVLDNAKFYPTKFIINVANCVIHLSQSYCAYGYSEFIVDQTKGYTCTIYDSNSDSVPIFNGSLLGAGIYKLKAYCNPFDNIIHNYRQNGGPANNDSINYIWDIIKISSCNATINVDDFGAVGDGITDDSSAVQRACNAGYDIYFNSNKTYYLASVITIDHDISLHGGKNTVIKTKTPTGGTVNEAFKVQGTLKKTTTLTSDYTSKEGNTDNCVNKFTFSDMTGIDIGDIFVIAAPDQYYNYARQYYYLGATLLVTDIFDGHIYSCMNMPWNIENTANVTVSVYSAPTATFENLHFVSDLDSRGHYNYCISLRYCKNSTIKNCSFNQIDDGIHLYYCINCNIDQVNLSKSKYDNSLTGDGYGICVYTCTNTIIEQVMATCAQHAITVTGYAPSINTYVKHCSLTSECRTPGLDTHESTYNLVIEDCTLGTASLNGTVEINRCRFINNKRASTNNLPIPIYGSHNPEWSKVHISNSIFDGTYIDVSKPSPQSPVQSYNNVVGSIEIENCYGGSLYYNPATDSTILSNTIQKLIIKNWKNCTRITFNGNNRIDTLIISDSEFINDLFINDGTSSHGIITNNIGYLDFENKNPMVHKISIQKETYGMNVLLPENTSIQLSSTNVNAKYIITGKNIVSNNINDYDVGVVSGNTGENFSRAQATGSGAPTISINSNNNLVATWKNNTGNYSVYPIGMVYVEDISDFIVSATIKNTGTTSGASFRAGIAIVDCNTGKLTYRSVGSAATASAQGESITFTREVPSNSIVCPYLFCSSGVAYSETTFEDLVFSVASKFAPASIPNDEPYTAVRRTGDGTLYSLPGLNHIMSSEAIFNVSIQADYINSAGNIFPNASGVSF